MIIWFFPVRVFLKHKSKVTGACCFFKFLRSSVNDSEITRKTQNGSKAHAVIYLLSSLPGDNGLFGEVGERIFSRVEAMDGVIGVVGVELS